MMRHSRAAAIALALAATGCTVKTDGSTSTVTINRPGGALPGLAQMTPGTIATLPSSPPPEGRFAGTGRLTSSAGSGCRREISVNGLVVSGNRVRYQGFRGTLQAGSFVNLQSGIGFLYGVFDGDSFTGHLWQIQPACTYELSLRHVG